MTDITEPCPTKFIADDAHTDDAFGSHRTIAKTLADSIVDRAESMTIALIGRFGIGKSLVVRLLARQLQENPYCAVIVFNVWVHRGDVLRRAFMKTLLEALSNKRWISSTARAKAQQAMTRGMNVSRALSTPSAAAVAALWAVISFSVLALSAFRALQFPLSFGPLVLTALNGALLFIAFTVLMAILLWLLTPGLPIAAAFTPQGWSRTTTETSTAPDLTSIEFQESFKIAIQAALKDKPKKRLVIALDDIDRLEKDDVREVLAALRIFLDLRDSSEVAALMQQVWFITPHADLPDFITKDLQERLFDRRIVIPPPVLPMASRYFRQQFRVVLPKHHETEAIEVYSMLAEAWKSNPDSVVPRRINRFLNDVGTLHEEWNCEVPLKSIAHYVLKGPFTYNDISSATAIAGIPDWPTHMAALFFHVPPEQVAAVQHEPRMRLAIETGDAEALHAISGIEHFAETCEQIVRSMESTFDQSSEMLMNAAKALALLVDTEYARIWQFLIAAAMKKSTWPVDTSDLSGLRILLLRCDDAQRQHIEAMLFQDFTRGVNVAHISEIPALDIWFANANAYIEIRVGSQADIIAGSARFRIEVLRASIEDRFAWPLDPPIVLTEELKDAIVEICHGPDPLAYMPTIRKLIELDRDANWNRTVLNLTERVDMALATVPAHSSSVTALQVLLLLEELIDHAVAATERLDWYACHSATVLIAAGIRHSLPAAATAIATAVTRDPSIEAVGEGGMFPVNPEHFVRARDFLEDPYREPELVQAGAQLLRELGITRPLQQSGSWAKLAAAVAQA